MKNEAPTERQGQFLAYIFQYTLMNGCPPAEADMQRFFQITPPSVHSMVLTLERRGFIRRVPGKARSITLLLPPESLPPLMRAQDQGRQSTPGKAKKTTRKPGDWSATYQQLITWDKPALIALLKDLYHSSTATRDFIKARCQTDDNG